MDCKDSFYPHSHKYFIEKIEQCECGGLFRAWFEGNARCPEKKAMGKVEPC